MNHSRLPAVAAALLLALSLCGCVGDASGSTPTATPTSTPRASALADPYGEVRRLGYGVSLVLDAAVMGKILGSPMGSSIVKEGATQEVNDGSLLALATTEYGQTIGFQIIDPATNELAEPMAEWIF